MNEHISKVLAHLAAFRVILPETYQRYFLPDGERKSAWQGLNRLAQSGYLRSYPLSARRKYFTLSWKAIRWLRQQGNIVPKTYANAVKPLRLATVFAVAHYCELAPIGQRRPYRPSFDKNRFPNLVKQVSDRGQDPLRAKSFILDQEDVVLLVVDDGTENFVRKKLIDKVFVLLTPERFAEFAPLVRENKFRLAIITATSGRANEVNERIEETSPPFSYEVCIYPDLAELSPKLNQRLSVSK